MSAPQTTFVRRQEALRWLREHGITEHEWRAMRRAGRIERVKFGDGYGYYATAQIREVFLSHGRKVEI